MNRADFSHFYSWRLIKDENIAGLMAKFVECGHSRLVIGDRWCERLLDEPGFMRFLKQCRKKSGITFGGSHSPFMHNGEQETFEDDPRSRFLQRHRALLEILPGEFDIHTYTVHPGLKPPQMPLTEYRETIRRGLEYLVPVAEKNRICIALENAFQVSDTPEELIVHIEYFNSPALGCCYDVGHGNVKTAAPGKTFQSLAPSIQAYGPDGFAFCPYDMLERLLPYVVVSHLHDNDGLSDQHGFPGTGTVDWLHVISLLEQAPRLVSIEDEATPRNIPISDLCDLYDNLLKPEPAYAR